MFLWPITYIFPPQEVQKLFLFKKKKNTTKAVFILEDITKVLPTYQWLQQWLLHPNGGVRWN